MGELGSRLEQLIQSGHEDQLGFLAVADQARMQKVVRDNIKRSQRLADAEYKKCNPEYEPAEDDEVDLTFINAGVMGSEETVTEIARQLSGNPQPATVQTAALQPKKSFMQRMALPAGIAALAIGGPIAGGLVANYLRGDKDTNSVEQFQLDTDQPDFTGEPLR